jgi:apolipoprotein N-acyltransferase
MSARDFGYTLALASSGAALMTISAPPLNVWPLGIVAWVPLAIASATQTTFRAGLSGWVQGAMVHGCLLASVPVAVRTGGGMPPASSLAMALLLVLFEGARFGVTASVAAQATRNGWPLVLAFPASLVATEWAYPMIFPWTSCIFFQDAPVLLQAAELGGPLLVSLWVGVLNASLATAWVFRTTRGLVARYAAVFPVATLGAVVLFGSTRIATVEARTTGAPELTVGIVQGNVTNVRQEKRDPVAIYRTPSLDIVRRQKIDLLIWPETAIFRPVDFDDLPGVLSSALSGASSEPPNTQTIAVPLLTGVVLERRPPESPAHIHFVNPDGTWQEEKKGRYNSAVLATPDGQIQGVYDKQYLVPFGEYIPAEETFPSLRRLMPSAGAFSPGTTSSPLRLNGRRLLVFICYEDLMSEFVRISVEKNEPDLLVNLTSDAWFGASREPWLHLGLARMRAIEHRRYLVRATNTGVTAVVNASGNIVDELPPFRAGVSATSVHLLRSRTVYETVGNAVGWIAMVAATFLVVRRRRRNAATRCAGA